MVDPLQPQREVDPPYGAGTEDKDGTVQPIQERSGTFQPSPEQDGTFKNRTECSEEEQQDNTEWPPVLTIQEAVSFFEAQGLPRDPSAIRKYCKKKRIDCFKTDSPDTQDKWMVPTDKALAHIENLKLLQLRQEEVRQKKEQAGSGQPVLERSDTIQADTEQSPKRKDDEVSEPKNASAEYGDITWFKNHISEITERHAEENKDNRELIREGMKTSAILAQAVRQNHPELAGKTPEQIAAEIGKGNVKEGEFRLESDAPQTSDGGETTEENSPEQQTGV